MNGIGKNSDDPINRIIFAVSISLIISFSIFYISLSIYHNNKQSQASIGIFDLDNLEKNFFHQNFGETKKIFIVGSSQSRALNTTYIGEYLKKNGQNYTVYNLSINADSPSERLQMLDMIIGAKPNIVVYGISSRDFVNSASQDEFPNMRSSLPDPHKIFNDLFDDITSYFKFDSSFLQSPETDIFGILSGILQIIRHENHPVLDPYPNTPFIQLTNSDFQVSNVTNPSFLEVHFSLQIQPPEHNKQYLAFEKIIDTLRSHNVHVIVFVTPTDRWYINEMPQDQKKAFDLILNDLSYKSHVTVYSLWDKYSDAPIWHDPEHIAIKKDGVEMYSNDIAKIILNEIDS